MAADNITTMRRDDPKLSQSVAVCGIAIVVIVWLYLALSGMPELPIGMANGTYKNGCCGTVSLHDGAMTVDGRQRVRYVIEKDKSGAYVLPATFVGVSHGHRFAVAAGKYPLMLRLNDANYPTVIK